MRTTLSNQAIRRIATYKKSTVDAEIWERVDYLIDFMGEKDLIENLIKGMSTDEAESLISFIEQNYDITSVRAEEENDF